MPSTWSNRTDVDTLVPSAARTASGNGPTSAGFAGSTHLRAQVNVSAASGTTPSLTVVIEDSIDGGVTWHSVMSVPALTAAGVQTARTDAVVGPDVRARWEITGTTPSFTFEVLLMSA